MLESDTLRWIFAALLGAIGLWFIALNVWARYLGIVRKEYHSPLPFVGGVFSALAMALSPWESLHGWAWLPLVIDPGSALVVVSFVYACFATDGFRGDGE